MSGMDCTFTLGTDEAHVAYHGDPCMFDFCWYREARAKGAAPAQPTASVPGLMSLTRQDIEWLVWFARKHKGKAADVAQAAMEQNGWGYTALAAEDSDDC